MKNGQQSLFSREQRSNAMRVISILFAGCVLVNLYVFLPKLRQMYQEKYGSLELEKLQPVSTSFDSGADPDELKGEPTAEELLAQWRNERNTLKTSEDEGDDDADAEKFKNLRIIRAIPQTEAEISRAHDRSRRLDCEVIPAGEPVTLKDFKLFLTPWDASEANVNRKALFARREVLSIGFDMRAADRNQLPALSSNEIMKFLQSNYVSIQVRIEKDPLDGTEFLHPRPLATIAEFRGPRLTQAPREALTSSLKNYRGLGMYLSPGETPSLETMRTMVLVHRSERKTAELTGFSQIEPHYEYLFVRAVPGADNKLELHAFATSENRTQFHYLRENRAAFAPRLCTVHTMLAFTKYDFGGLNPIESVTTGSIIDDRSHFTMEQLDEFVRAQQLEGSALDNLNVVIDAIIKGEITAR